MSYQSPLIHNMVRRFKGEALTQADTDEIDAVIGAFLREIGGEASPDASGEAKAPDPVSNGLSDASALYARLRASFGPLDQGQVDGIGALLTAFAAARWPIAWAAYGLATAWWETNKTMQPVKEAYWLSESWRKANLRYFPHYGRGYVQLTWPRNYEWADEELGLDGALIADPDLALRPGIAARIMVKGMEQGAFTGKKLADYLPLSGEGGHEAFKAARRIINGQDKAEEIAKLADTFQGALAAGEWR